MDKALVVDGLEELIEKLKEKVSTVEMIDEKTEKSAKSVILQKRRLNEETSLVFVVNTDISREVHCRIDLNVLDLYDFSISCVGDGTLRLTSFPAGSVCFLITKERITCEEKPKTVISTGAVFQRDLRFEKALNRFEVTLCDPNVLILDRVISYEVEGREILRDVHASRI